MNEPESNPESREKAVLNDDLLASFELATKAAAEMADRLKTLMECHSRMAAIPEHTNLMGVHGIMNMGRSAHWWMEQMGEYFNATDAVDSDSQMDQSWDAALDAARKFFPLKDGLRERIEGLRKTPMFDAPKSNEEKKHLNRAIDAVLALIPA